MDNKTIDRIIDLVTEAYKLAQSVGIDNLLQGGLVKEMIIAKQLGHDGIFSKHGADACAPTDSSIQYEYLSCIEGNQGQLDRMYKEPPEKRDRSLIRITRNRNFYFAVFYRNDQIKLKAIYELDPKLVLEEAKRKLDRSTSSHIGFGINWAKRNGTLVYEDKAGS